MKMGRIVNSFKEAIKSGAKAIFDDIRSVAMKYAEKSVDRTIQLVLHEDNSSAKLFETYLRNTFDSTARRLNNLYRSWRTTVTNKWRKKGGDIAEKTFRVVVRWAWVCTFNNSRDSHMDMHMQERDNGEPFISGLGNPLRYPGDRKAPIEDWINCQCYLVKVGQRRIPK